MMKYGVFIAIIFASSSIKALGPLWVKINNQKIELQIEKQSLFSSNCQKTCMARDFLHMQIKLRKREVDFKNPYSIVCNKINSKLAIGKLHNGHSQSFCIFQDESLLSTNSFKIDIAD